MLHIEDCHAFYSREIQLGERKIRGHALVLRGDYYLEQSLFDLAKADYARAIELFADSPKPRLRLVRAFFLAANYTEAIQECDDIVQRFPGNAEAYCSRGRAFRKLKDFDKGIASLDEAIRIAPSYAEAFVERSLTHLGNGEPSKAIADAKRAIELDPLPEYYLVLAAIHGAQDDPKAQK